MINKGPKIVIVLLLIVTLFTLVSYAQLDESDPVGTSVSEPSTLLIGDYIFFGQYYDEPILWRVTSFDQERNPILYSEEILCYKAFDSADSGIYNAEIYNEIPNATATEIANALGSSRWLNSTIRTWLNSNQKQVDYLGEAPKATALAKKEYAYDKEAGFLSHFSESEYSVLVPVTHKTLLINNPEVTDAIDGGTLNNDLDSTYGTLTYGHYDDIRYEEVTDKVFLLSSKEFTNWIVSKGWNNTAKPSSIINQIKPHKKEFALWLRTVGGRPDNPLCVYADLKGGHYNSYNDYTGSEADFGIRPALCIRDENVKIIEGVGEKKAPYKIEIIPPEAVEKNKQSEKMNISKEAFFKDIIDLYERLSYEKAPPIANNPFIDTANENVIKAYQLDLITDKEQVYFEPLRELKQQEIQVIMDRLLKVVYGDQKISIKYVLLANPKDYLLIEDVETLIQDTYKLVKSQIGGQFKICAFGDKEISLDEDLIWLNNQFYLPAEKVITKLGRKTSGIVYKVNDGIHFIMEMTSLNGESLNLYSAPDWNRLIVHRNGQELPWLTLDNSPLIMDDIYMVPVEVFEKGFNLAVEVDKAERVIRIDSK